ncbi:MAG: VgrG-related protein [Ilumatobacter sp.]|uniref:VgrG-related protein n=1 Tax=Ilumatobacter sp. TaxID=1967498 RepID=UPI002632B38F|nr:VgrG-related protein [Ilumatobacter sp.]MDJ0770654.1 VgrG-related protein [Ilumatobacter sp.]
MTRSQLPFVGIDGQAVRDEVRRELIEAIVDDHAVLPDSFALRFRFDDPELWTRLGARIGQTLEIKSGDLGESPDASLIKGEITAIEAVFEDGARYLVVRGYDASHRLHAGRRTRSFNNVTDSDLARRIAGDAGLDIGTIDSSSTVHDHVSQINTTDWDFLRSRAKEIGYRVGVRDGRFEFTAAGSGGGGGGGLGGAVGGVLGGGGGVELTVGDQLLMFRPRVTGAQQVGRVEARGWDMARKEPVTHETDAATESVSLGERGWSPAELARVFDSPEFLACDLPIATSAEARSVAEATAEEIASSYAEAEGTAEGNPRLVTGGTVAIAGAGPFDGDYVVSHTRHRFDEDGYHTDFEVAGRQERSLLGLASLGETGTGAPPINGAVVAIVTNAQDPEKLGRVKLRFPWLSDDYESDWARVTFPGAGPDRGFFVVPEVDDEVLVLFERGDMRRPYVLGGLYNGVDAPPAVDYCDSADGAVKIRRWMSRGGHEISISDYDDENSIFIKTADNEYGIVISKADEHIYVKSNGKVVLEGPNGIELKGGDVTISGGTIKLDASSTLEMKGANAKLEGSGQTEVKGGVVKIN